MKTKLLFVTILLFSPLTYANSSGELLFDAKCATCHVKFRPSDVSTLVAPPLMGVMRHVKMTYATKEEAVRFITEYTLDPQESKSVCMTDKIKRFGLMPSQKGNVTKEELQVIAAWMYDNFGNQGQGMRNCQNGNCSGKGNGQGRGKACRSNAQ